MGNTTKEVERTLEGIREEAARVGETRVRLLAELVSLKEERNAEALEESRLQEEALRTGKPAKSSKKLASLDQREEEVKRQLSTIEVLEKRLEFERLGLEIEEAEQLSGQLEEEYKDAEKAFRAAESRFHQAGFASRDHSQHRGDLERARRRAEAELAAVDPETAARLEEERRERVEAAERARQLHQEQMVAQRWAEAGFHPCETPEQREALKEYAAENERHTRITFPTGG